MTHDDFLDARADDEAEIDELLSRWPCLVDTREYADGQDVIYTFLTDSGLIRRERFEPFDFSD